MNLNNIKRCSMCIIPESAEGIILDENGLCQLCRNYKKVKPRGENALRNEIERSIDVNADYNCIVPVSGGRDSSYVLYFVKEKLKLKPLAVHSDNDFETEIAKKNLENITKSMDVPLIRISSKKHLLKKIVVEKFKMNATFGPGLVMDQTCEPCKYGFEAGSYNTARKHDIRTIIWGDSREESTTNYHALANHIHPTKRERLLSPALINLFKYKYYFNKMKKEYGQDSPDGLKEIHFFDYIEWDRELIANTIQNKMGWSKPDDSATSWRIDCHLVPLINYLTKIAYGVSKIELGFSQMIRNGKMGREEALQQVEQIDKATNVDQLKDFLKEEMSISDICAGKVLN